jgi:hypothetical protein
VANKIVTLDSPIVGHEVVRQLEFREPRWDDIMEIGEAYIWTPRGDGSDFSVVTPVFSNIKLYAERLIAKGDRPGDPLVLAQLGVGDTRKVRDAIVDFFLRADPAVAGSTTSPKTSSSSADGTLPSSGS